MPIRPTQARKILRLLTIPLMVLILIAGGCGGDGDDSSSTTETSVTPSTNDQTSTSDTTATTESTTTTSTTTTTTTTTTTDTNATTVKVFFSSGDPDECGAVVGFERTARSVADPIRFAFDELVKGPRSSEKSDGAFSFFSGITNNTVRSTTTDGDVLVVDFDDFRAALTPSGASTSCGSAALLGQLNATAFQFDEVDTVRYELEGSCNAFGEWLQRDCIEVDRDDWEAEVAAQLPGQAFDGILPQGAVLNVIGVRADDVLNVRALPGHRENIVDTLEPLAGDLVFSGRERLIGNPVRIWYEIDTGTTTGWVNSWFVAPLAGTVDVTSKVVADVGEIPTGETVVEIAEIVIDSRISGFDIDPRIVMVDGPHEGDLLEVTFDVLGFRDDSVQGERLHIFITPAEETDGPMSLKSVELTWICARGGGGGELCP